MRRKKRHVKVSAWHEKEKQIKLYEIGDRGKKENENPIARGQTRKCRNEG